MPKISQKLLEISFYTLFLLVPLILTPVNYELFEYNKMMLVYFLTVIIAAAWFIKIISLKKINLQKTSLDLPVIIFLTSQLLSTIFSIDRHVSLWGYYSRFNGSLLSTLSYVILFYAFVSNFPATKIKKLISLIFISAFLVSIYGILERLGIDKNIWVQDVQLRVFSTLGQPNWLAAYLAVLILPALSFYLVAETKRSRFNYLVLSLIFFSTLIFTKSRSGFLGLGFGLIIFWLINFLIYKRKILKVFLILNSLFLILIFIFGTPFSQINRFTLPEINKKLGKNSVSTPESKPLGTSVIDVGITESGKIRNIVWKGAIAIFKHHPIIGTGVETFAYSYFKFRPLEHNMTSEWDFLYNKAHNEYLNFAANSGILGLVSYLLFIASFIFYFIKRFQTSPLIISRLSGIPQAAGHDSKFIILGLFSGWLTILVTNFFGFSVVIIQLLFFLIPAIIIRFTTSTVIKNPPDHLSLNPRQKILNFFVCLFALFFLIKLLLFWLADYYFAKGFNFTRSQDYGAGYSNIKKAIILNDKEPFYKDELAMPAVQLGMYFAQNKDSTASAKYINEAILANQQALEISPNNLNFWKTRTRLLYALVTLDDKYLEEAKNALIKAVSLSPTDPKIHYNLALIYDAADEKENAYKELEETIRLKINYTDAYLAKATFYARDGQDEKAKEALNFILTKLDPDNAEAKKQLEELK